MTVPSEVCGIAKSDPAIYRQALELLGLPGEACVFADDQEANLPPAAALGMTTIHPQEPEGTARRAAGLFGLASYGVTRPGPETLPGLRAS